MFWRATKVQTRQLLRQWPALLVFAAFMYLVARNFLHNVRIYKGTEVYDMYQSMHLLLLSYDSLTQGEQLTSTLIQLFPFLVALPAGLSYARDRQVGISNVMIARMGKRTYCMSKLLSVFLTTFVVFTVPFLIEIGLSCISFPLNATDTFSHASYYDEYYLEMIGSYLFPKLYIVSPYFYAVVMTLQFGMIASLFACFVMGFSMLVPLRFRVLYLLPPYIMLSSVVYFFPNRVGASHQFWYYYVLIFNTTHNKHVYIYGAVLCALALFSVFSALWKSRKDTL